MSGWEIVLRTELAALAILCISDLGKSKDKSR
jgi:hypothetical protein